MQSVLDACLVSGIALEERLRVSSFPQIINASA